MKGLTSRMRLSLLRLATALSTLLVGITFALTTSVASAAVINNVMIDINKVVFDINKVVIVKPHPVVNVMVPVKEAVVHPVVKSDSRVRQVRPFFARPFFARPFGFNPFFDEDFD
jgi:hypothetical protein